jgi:hypothetical protein
MNIEFKRFKSIVKMVADAFVNPSTGRTPPCTLCQCTHVDKYCAVYIGFDAEEFNRRKVTGESFPNPQIGLVDVPATFVDSRGRIVVWYLPDLLPPHIHVRALEDQSQTLLSIIQFQG